MQLKLGEKIKAFRKRDGRTQEDLANALGVTCQAVSRWESGGGYPDMEAIPSIANYFGISIDELFGYHGDRERKIDDLLRRVDKLDSENVRCDNTLDECLSLLRQGLAEFPGNERITHRLAVLLSEAGWRRHHEWMDYDETGYIRYDFDRHQKNPYWKEAVSLFESLTGSADADIRTDSICNLIILYRNIGQCEKGIALSHQLPMLEQSREIMLASATYGKEQSGYLGEALLKMAWQFSEQVVYGLVADLKNYETDMPVRKVEGAIAVFELVCDDGNLGPWHSKVAYLYLYLSRLQWEYGMRDEVFVSLDKALEHGRAYDAFMTGNDPVYTAPLVRLSRYDTEGWIDPGGFTEHLSNDWPMWCNPDYSKVEAEIKADPRWAAWVRRTKG